jgi:hypothetical protein
VKRKQARIKKQKEREERQARGEDIEDMSPDEVCEERV